MQQGSSRPVLVGMNNPLGDNPEYALFPAPEGCTGWRIWQMLHERTGATRSDYMHVFERMNVMDSVTWDRSTARVEANKRWPLLSGRTVVFLGQQVVWSFQLPKSEPLEWQNPEPDFALSVPLRWCLMPHPSGLNHWYNDPVNRMAASLRLEQLYVEAGGTVRS